MLKKYLYSQESITVLTTYSSKTIDFKGAAHADLRVIPKRVCIPGVTGKEIPMEGSVTTSTSVKAKGTIHNDVECLQIQLVICGS